MKKILCGIMAALLLGSCSALATPIDLPEYIIPQKYDGDYNQDGHTDAEDLVSLAKYLSGDKTAITTDQTLDLLDLVKLMKELAKARKCQEKNPKLQK